MPIKHVIELHEGDVFVTPAKAQRSQFRRVIGVLGGRVIYSVGADVNRSCLARTFKRWIRSNNALTPRAKQTQVWSL